MNAVELAGVIAAIIAAVSPLYVHSYRQRRNGNGSQRWNHDHAKLLAQHETEIALIKQEQVSQGKRVEKLGERTHDLANSIQEVLFKLRLEEK